MTHEITLTVSITPEAVRRALLAALLAVPTVCSTQDVSDLTTYFPQPRASFRPPGGNMGVASLVVSGTTHLARDFGSVTFGHPGTNSTRVFIGREHPDPFAEGGAPARGAPQNPVLRVSGGMRLDGCLWLHNGGATLDETRFRCRWDP